jgi:hypothetical protein
VIVCDMRTLYVKDRKRWRSWLAKNGQCVKEIWLIYPKKHSGKVRIPYDHAVEEALCFGWIDGITGKLDANRYAQRFTPRRPTSRWSAINIRRARKLIAAGKASDRLAEFSDLPDVLPAHDHRVGGQCKEGGHAGEAAGEVAGVFFEEQENQIHVRPMQLAVRQSPNWFVTQIRRRCRLPIQPVVLRRIYVVGRGFL